MLVDANLLLYATNADSEQHDAAREWLSQQLNGPRRVGLPWQSLAAFLRVATHPRASEAPLSPAVAWDRVARWLAAPVAWTPVPGPQHAEVVGELITGGNISGNLVTDAFLAALAI